jgi:hypothetical protein
MSSSPSRIFFLFFFLSFYLCVCVINGRILPCAIKRARPVQHLNERLISWNAHEWTRSSIAHLALLESSFFFFSLNKKGKSNFFVFLGDFENCERKQNSTSTPTVGVHKVRRVERATFTMLEKDAPQIGRSWSCWPPLVSTSIPHVHKHTETDGQGVSLLYIGGEKTWIWLHQQPTGLLFWFFILKWWYSYLN